jgi:hypothetical protein
MSPFFGYFIFSKNELQKVAQLVKNSPMFGLSYERINIAKATLQI